MTNLSAIGTEKQSVEGRSVRDIVETSPELVNEVWCRKIFRQILQSLELQYAMQMPHRAITPDTIVFHENGEPLLLPSSVEEPEHDVSEDLCALARIIHYAITRELIPSGPLQGRALPGYSDSLITAVDRCMAADPAQRPATIDALRDILGIVSLGTQVVARPAVPHPDAPESAALPAAAAVAGTDEALPSFMRGGADGGARTRFGAGLGRWQRWALAAGGGAALIAVALVGYAELRDSGTFDHIELSLPQTGGAGRDSKVAILTDTPAAVAAQGAAPGAVGASDGGTTASGAQSEPGGVQAGAASASGTAAANAAGTGTPQSAPPSDITDAAADQQPPAERDVRAAPVRSQASTTPAARSSRANGAAATGLTSVRLRIQPWGVIYVDGVDRGVSPPVKRITLAAGRHTIRVVNPAFRDRVVEIDGSGGQVAVNFNDGAR